MNGKWVDKVNGYGVIFRFITPIMVTITIFIISLIMTDLKEVLRKFDNHLEHHRSLEKSIEGRLARMETLLLEKK